MAKTKEEKAAYDREYREKNREKIVAWRKKYRAKHGDMLNRKQREWANRDYPAYIAGIARRREERLIERAGRPRAEACEICGDASAITHFDHDHETGKFRGWLCGNCNRALGIVKDDAQRLRALADYLEARRG
jgi:hypothetical protein